MTGRQVAWDAAIYVAVAAAVFALTRDWIAVALVLGIGAASTVGALLGGVVAARWVQPAVDRAVSWVSRRVRRP